MNTYELSKLDNSILRSNEFQIYYCLLCQFQTNRLLLERMLYMYLLMVYIIHSYC